MYRKYWKYRMYRHDGWSILSLYFGKVASLRSCFTLWLRKTFSVKHGLATFCSRVRSDFWATYHCPGCTRTCRRMYAAGDQKTNALVPSRLDAVLYFLTLRSQRTCRSSAVKSHFWSLLSFTKDSAEGKTCWFRTNFSNFTHSNRKFGIAHRHIFLVLNGI